MKLKRLGRDLAGRPRLVHSRPWQEKLEEHGRVQPLGLGRLSSHGQKYERWSADEREALHQIMVEDATVRHP